MQWQVGLCCLLRDFDLRKFDCDFSWTRNHSGRSECIRLRNHGAKVVLNHKQFFTNAIQLLQNESDLFDPNHLSQVRVNH